MLSVIIPCKDEEESIGLVIEELKNLKMDMDIIVVDNNSIDNTYEVAKAHDVTVLREPTPGKSAAISTGLRKLKDSTTSVFMLDGDGTYSVEELSIALVKMNSEGFHLVNGVRVPVILEDRKPPFPKWHNLGNLFLSFFYSLLFGKKSPDILSGWRLMSRNFVESLTINKNGFTLEVDLNAHCYELGISSASIPVQYKGRKFNSSSKLMRFRHGIEIAVAIISSFRRLRPSRFYSFIAVPILASSLVLFSRVISTFSHSGEFRLPSLIIASICAASGFGVILVGQILKYICELRRLFIRKFFQSY